MCWSGTERSLAADRLIIGYGNRLRGDDGAGPAVVDALLAHDADCPAITCHQLLPELAETISHWPELVLIDACADRPAGSVHWRGLSAPARCEVPRMHVFDAGALLGLTQLLYGRAPRTWLVTIGGCQWDRPDELSAPVWQAVRRVCDALRAAHVSIAATGGD